ncbi:MAG: ABC transporter ATP-binding protein [Bacillota bacterium]|nr:ABC transporter ATP-binding protein [Bacillota bacterium]MDW7684190.1 ABC transporter ATP-binding protein [Bacillota bacterium]
MKNRVLQVNGIWKSFGRKQIIKGVSLSLSQGEVFGFIGPNGAGKTTLIRIILGLVRPNQGTVQINGFDIRKNFKRAISGVGAVVENPRFYPYLSGYQNLLLIRNLHPDVPKTKVSEALEIVGLADRGKDKVLTYSLGMKQRLGLARSLVNNPKIVFLDEPMNGLDPQGMYDIRELIKQLRREHGITFFITSHLLHEVEQLCDNVAVLKDGITIADGPIRHLLQSDSETVEIYPHSSAAAGILQGLSFIRSVVAAGDKLTVEIDKGTSAELNRILVKKNIDVSYLIPKKHSLEEYFIRMAHGGEGPDRVNQKRTD